MDSPDEMKRKGQDGMDGLGFWGIERGGEGEGG